ncbi:MAG TPA: hypothetical protein VNX21_01385 [Candidatus Thermoplasmatota archaeon]|nr:hypothetical protein [Candidatus Thermoplasmatota archaeon]
MARNTTCTTIDDIWDGVPGLALGLGVIGAIGLLVAGVWTLVLALSAAAITPMSLAIAAGVLMASCLAAIFLLHQVRDYFFDHRLLCLGDDACAMAHVITIEANGDGDRSLNTILAPANADTPEADYQGMFQAAELVYSDPALDADLATRGWTLVPKANRLSLNPRTFGRGELPFFHCEIEGTKLDDWTIALIAWLWGLFALGAAALAAAALATALGPIAWAIWIAVAIFVLLAAIFGLSLSDEDTGSAPAAPIGDATPDASGVIITDTGGNAINLGDFIAMLGRPIADTAHSSEGVWKELHPLKAVTKIRQSEYEQVPVTRGQNDILERYCAALRGFADETGTIRQGLTCLEHERIG